MNERIRELLLKAASDYNDANGVFIPDDFVEKFAELIVKDCGYYADIFESLGCPVDMDPTETKPSDYIKKHFGVE